MHRIKQVASFKTGWTALKPAKGCESGLNIYTVQYVFLVISLFVNVCTTLPMLSTCSDAINQVTCSYKTTEKLSKLVLGILWDDKFH